MANFGNGPYALSQDDEASDIDDGEELYEGDDDDAELDELDDKDE